MRKILPALLVLAAVYFPAALWLRSAADPHTSTVTPNVAGEKLLLLRPFSRFVDSPFAAVATDSQFATLADTAENNDRSRIELYEDDKRLGPAHSVHADVGSIGLGHFSHWRYNYSEFVFSSSDNTDPLTNGRNYWAVKPE